MAWSDAAREAAALARKQHAGKGVLSKQQRGVYSLKADNRTMRLGQPGTTSITAGGKEHSLTGAVIHGQDVHLKGGRVVAGESITHMTRNGQRIALGRAAKK